jgi:AmmeMemoRadiSam system protein A
MHLAEKKGWQATLIDYKNSGDTAGEKTRVVGYAAIAFVDRKETISEMSNDQKNLSVEAKKELLQFARTVIAAKLDSKTVVQRPKQSCDAFFQERGCFVTLHKKGQLRGCIGSIQPVSSLVSCIEENAYNAAFRDPRFSLVTKEELTDIDLEISVLTVPQKIEFKDGEDLKRQLEPLSHGVILSSGSRRSTFLPQVWKQLPDKEKFLEHLCLKGGMAPNAWQNPKTTVEVYKAEVFGEKDFE